MIRTMLGDPKPFLPVVSAVLAEPWTRRPGRPELVRVALSFGEGGRVVASVAGVQGSAHLLGMADASGFLLVAGDTTQLSGEVPVQVFDWSWTAGAGPSYRWAGGAG